MLRKGNSRYETLDVICGIGKETDSIVDVVTNYAPSKRSLFLVHQMFHMIKRAMVSTLITIFSITFKNLIL